MDVASFPVIAAAATPGVEGVRPCQGHAQGTGAPFGAALATALGGPARATPGATCGLPPRGRLGMNGQDGGAIPEPTARTGGTDDGTSMNAAAWLALLGVDWAIPQPQPVEVPLVPDADGGVTAEANIEPDVAAFLSQQPLPDERGSLADGGPDADASNSVFSTGAAALAALTATGGDPALAGILGTPLRPTATGAGLLDAGPQSGSSAVDPADGSVPAVELSAEQRAAAAEPSLAELEAALDAASGPVPTPDPVPVGAAREGREEAPQTTTGDVSVYLHKDTSGLSLADTQRLIRTVSADEILRLATRAEGAVIEETARIPMATPAPTSLDAALQSKAASDLLAAVGVMRDAAVRSAAGRQAVPGEDGTPGAAAFDQQNVASNAGDRPAPARTAEPADAGKQAASFARGVTAEPMGAQDRRESLRQDNLAEALGSALRGIGAGPMSEHTAGSQTGGFGESSRRHAAAHAAAELAGVYGGTFRLPSLDISTRLAELADQDPPGGVAAGPDTPTVAGEPLNHAVIRSLKLQWIEGGGEARLRLQPEHLGEITVSLRVQGASVTATLYSESPVVRGWIDSHQADLRRALESQGLSLDRLDVDADGEQQQQQEQPSQEEQRHTYRRRQTPGRFEALL